METVILGLRFPVEYLEVLEAGVVPVRYQMRPEEQEIEDFLVSIIKLNNNERR
jgi:hypothetical protein